MKPRAPSETLFLSRNREGAVTRALFLSPEPPLPGAGGGGLRSASLLEYLRQRYSVDVLDFNLRPHSKSFAAKAWRNSMRLLRGVPPLFDRYSGYEDQLSARLGGSKYALGVIEHFWCAGYAPILRDCCETLVLDLHNIESELARTHARAARWPASWASGRFAEAYQRLEREWLPRFDIVLTASEDDARLIQHPHMIVYPNALPEIPAPREPEENCIVFSGNLEYHPNIEAVRWFRTSVWPRIRERSPGLEWRLIGKNPDAVARWTSGDDRIRATGPVEDAVAEIARAKLAVVPLLSGSGTRFKILEAWAAERAVVSTPIGAAGLNASDGEHLLLAQGASALASAVLRLLDDPSLRAQLGQSGRALYLNRFTWPRAWESLSAAGI
jgi:glycosyltransferase involved in cell wall biosynthesis